METQSVDIAEAALEAHIDYLDIYYQQDVYPVLESLKERIAESGQCKVGMLSCSRGSVCYPLGLPRVPAVHKPPED